MHSFVRRENALGSLVLHGLRVYAIRVIVIQNKQILVSIVGWGNETSCLVRVYLPSDFDIGRVAVVSAFIRVLTIGKGVAVIITFGFVLSWCHCVALGGLHALACLVEVSHNHCFGVRRVAAQRVDCEAGEVEDLRKFMGIRRVGPIWGITVTIGRVTASW
jgi:hypothetical protein